MMLQREDGIAMATVVMGAAIAILLSAVIVTRGANDLGDAVGNRQFEQAIHGAEAGVDDALFRIAADQTWDTGEVAPAFADADAEEEWVLTAALERAVSSVAGAEWAVVKPDNLDVVYAVGYSPDRADSDRVRVLRVAYDFAPFSPSTAVLSGGDLTISGNAVVSGASGNVHTNGNATVSGDPTTSGYVAASGTYTVTGSPTVGDTGNSGGAKPSRDVPDIAPRDFYEFSEYDLCTDGFVYGGPAYDGAEANATTTPCAGGVLGDANSQTFRGWRLTSGTWAYSGSTPYDGVYYVYQGSASISGSPGTAETPWNLTLLAEATPTTAEPHCPHTGGDVDVTGSPLMRAHSTAYPLQIMAGRDLMLSGTASGGANNYDGFLFAHEQFRVSGTPQMTGSLVGEDACDTSGSPVTTSEITGNATFIYEGDLELPSGNIPRATLWEEL